MRNLRTIASEMGSDSFFSSVYRKQQPALRAGGLAFPSRRRLTCETRFQAQRARSETPIDNSIEWWRSDEKNDCAQRIAHSGGLVVIAHDVGPCPQAQFLDRSHDGQCGKRLRHGRRQDMMQGRKIALRDLRATVIKAERDVCARLGVILVLMLIFTGCRGNFVIMFMRHMHMAGMLVAPSRKRFAQLMPPTDAQREPARRHAERDKAEHCKDKEDG